MLAVDRLNLAFGGIKVLDNVSFTLGDNEILGLIGPNGAGKTSVMNVIAGIHPPKEGHIRLGTEDITGQPPHVIAASGIRRTFQTSLLCGGLTVLENVMLGIEPRIGYGFWPAFWGLKSVQSQEAKARRQAMDMLDWVGMSAFADRQGTSLSFGQQRLVEIARALVSQPKIILLDEPAVGLAAPRVEELSNKIKQIRGTFGTAVLLIEHVMQLVLDSCDRVIVMNAGKVIASGNPHEVTKDPKVIESYLGRSYYAES